MRGSKTHGKRRSPKWPAFERGFLKGKVCAACGGRKKLVGHHIKPFHLFPALELVASNLLPLCEGNPALNCHLVIGHNGNFQRINPNAVADAAALRAKLTAA